MNTRSLSIKSILTVIEYHAFYQLNNSTYFTPPRVRLLKYIPRNIPTDFDLFCAYAWAVSFVWSQGCNICGSPCIWSKRKTPVIPWNNPGLYTQPYLNRWRISPSAPAYLHGWISLSHSPSFFFYFNKDQYFLEGPGRKFLQIFHSISLQCCQKFFQNLFAVPAKVNFRLHKSGYPLELTFWEKIKKILNRILENIYFKETFEKNLLEIRRNSK